MKKICLPSTFPDETDLVTINQRLLQHDAMLDWSQVSTASQQHLRVLLAGLDLVEHGDLLGLETIPEHLTAAIQQALSDGATYSQEIRERPTKPFLAAPSPSALRDELEQLVLLDLLGPAGGAEEEVNEGSVRDRYLVGMLAPSYKQLTPEEAVRAWLDNAIRQRQDRLFHEVHRKWRAARYIKNPDAGYPGLRYVLLHSLAHALIRQLTLECGYTTASIRERIYSLPAEHDDGPMAGILLYTSATDSEGTLGGLVSLGEPAQLARHLNAALERMQSCASDPLCAEHSSLQDITLHEAACHACLFIPETSCERGNKYLDRSVLVPTVERDQLAFFPLF